MEYYKHETAEISPKAQIGKGTKVWNHCQIRENAVIGENVILSKGVYIDSNVKIGNNVKIQNYVSVFQGVELKNGVFIGPHVCFTNDLFPRAINPDGSLKQCEDWMINKTIVEEGASIGANSTIVAGVKIGKFAMIGAGSVVTKDINDFELAYGNPAKVHGKVNKNGKKVE